MCAKKQSKSFSPYYIVTTNPDKIQKDSGFIGKLRGSKGKKQRVWVFTYYERRQLQPF